MAKNPYRKRPRTIVLYAFGKSQSAIKLAQEVSELNDVKIQSKIGKYYSEFASHFKQLEKTDTNTKHHCSALIRNEYKEIILDRCEWPGSIRLLLIEVLNQLYHRHTCWVIELIHNQNKYPGKCDECGARPTVRYITFGKTKSRYCDIHKFLIEKDKTNDNRNKN